MLGHVKYFKKPAEIKAAVEKRLQWLTDKVATRHKRIKETRAKFSIDDMTLANIMMVRANNHSRSTQTYSVNNSSKICMPGMDNNPESIQIPAGEIDNICTEMEWIEKELEEHKTLFLTSKHMDMTAERFEVSLADLRHFEF